MKLKLIVICRIVVYLFGWLIYYVDIFWKKNSEIMVFIKLF